jgi:hypothetical protein
MDKRRRKIPPVNLNLGYFKKDAKKNTPDGESSPKPR